MSETIEWVRAVWHRRKWLAVLAFVVPMVVGVTVVMVMPNVYRATATVLVERQQIPENLVSPTVTSALETRLRTINQEVLSRPRLEALRNQFGLYPDRDGKYFSIDQIVERMRNDIQFDLKGVDVRGQAQATVAFTLSYLGAVPETVAKVANTLASFYIEENLKARGRQASGTAEFLRSQLAETKQRLDAQERHVSEFKRRYLGELPQQMEANLATLERLQMQLRLTADAQTRAQERRSVLLAQLTEAQAVAPAGTPEATPARLARLKQDLTEMRTRYSDKYPDVVALEAEIAALTRELEEARQGGKPSREAPVVESPLVTRVKTSLGEVDVELKALKAEEARLRGTITAYQQRVEKIPQREQEFKDLSRDYEATREFYQSLLKRHDEAQIAESMEQRQKSESFRIIEPATVPTRPVTSRSRLILIVTVLSVAAAAAAMLITEQLDTSFHTVEQVRNHTSVPLLVSIPQIVTDSDVAARRSRVRLATVAAGLGLVMLIAISYFVAHGNEQIVWALARGRS